ncbi:hypothetical protein L228DRAFT_276057 [Xylona heveae TC161]|uniref:Zn(2)-C6 fungal-type domain-containing protein n=1 Tax=Xylona heveae (strain CBS 132557 / TC161) TaxID=1328760 RepID=A0A165IF52_XYLHT|nr:hypothetical protein L228DRAFT_276057 [Xylona heveae TC161]KZF24809.1 hypothetical protein L228DRAFT_276057 [Xylona heveae TC161]
MNAQKRSRQLSAPDDPVAPHVKRRRDAIACHSCRSRKLKCDRGYPSCDRCLKSGQGRLCTYDVHVPGASNGSATPAGHSRRSSSPWKIPGPGPGGQDSNEAPSNISCQNDKITQLERQIIQLRTELENLSSTLYIQSRSSQNTICTNWFQLGREKSSLNTETTEIQPINFRGRGFQTQFYGPSNPYSFRTYFPELHHFIKERIISNPSMLPMEAEIRSQKNKWKQNFRNTKFEVRVDALSHLPQKHIADEHMELYISTFENIYQVLHVPTFRTDYETFWKNPSAGDPGFAALMIVIMSTVHCATASQPLRYFGASSSQREKAETWIRVADSWLQRQSQKHTHLRMFQVHCLLVLAKQVNEIKPKATWNSAETLLRSCIVAGLHREPSLLGEDISAFDQEMRRRIWATAVQLELDSAIDRGVSSSLVGLAYDSRPPSNLDDEDFTTSSLQLPRSKLRETFTKSSFQHISPEMLELKVSLSSWANEKFSMLNYPEILNFGTKIMAALNALPTWGSSSDNASANHTRTCTPWKIACSLLEVELCTMLILLHANTARKANLNPQFGYSLVMTSRAAERIFACYSDLASNGSIHFCLLRDDLSRAALHLSYAHFQSSSIEIEARILSVGRGFHHYALIASAFGFMKASISPENSDLERQNITQRVTLLIQRILECQSDDLNLLPSVELTTSRVPWRGGMDHQMAATKMILSLIKMLLSSLQINSTTNDLSINPFEQIEFSGWDLDNLWMFDWPDF